MSDPAEALILDLLEWIERKPRSYAETIEAWRTSCPRFPIWEEASDRKYFELHEGNGGVLAVSLTPLGREFLGRHRGVGHTPGTPTEA